MPKLGPRPATHPSRPSLARSARLRLAVGAVALCSACAAPSLTTAAAPPTSSTPQATMPPVTRADIVAAVIRLAELPAPADLATLPAAAGPWFGARFVPVPADRGGVTAVGTIHGTERPTVPGAWILLQGDGANVTIDLPSPADAPTPVACMDADVLAAPLVARGWEDHGPGVHPLGAERTLTRDSGGLHRIVTILPRRTSEVSQHPPCAGQVVVRLLRR